MDSIDYRLGGGGGGGSSVGKSQPDVYSTLPHLRNMDGGGGGGGSMGGAAKSNASSFAYHYDNKSYERFEPLITATQQAKYDKHKLDQANETPVVLTTFGHKRSPSGESLSRNLHLAGAKLVLPTGGEMPTLKPVDKSAVRPKLPPPGPPAAGVVAIVTGYPAGGGAATAAAANNGSASSGVTNGQSSESINSVGDGPVAPPRKVSMRDWCGLVCGIHMCIDISSGRHRHPTHPTHSHTFFSNVFSFLSLVYFGLVYLHEYHIICVLSHSEKTHALRSNRQPYHSAVQWYGTVSQSVLICPVNLSPNRPQSEHLSGSPAHSCALCRFSQCLCKTNASSITRCDSKSCGQRGGHPDAYPHNTVSIEIP